jgi:DNA-binding LacI/PurR family transcriptional regulator
MKPKKLATIWDVARLAQVSPGTVSRAMSGNPRISEPTRCRVLRAVEELAYKPNLAARSLSTGKTRSIAVLVPFFTRPAVSERLNGALAVLAESPYDLVIHNVATPEQRALCFHDIPPRGQTDGVLVISLSPGDDEVPRLLHAAVPVVLIDADYPGLAGLDRIVADDVAGGRAATEHLIGLGHKRIGYVGECLDDPFAFASTRDRYRGYCDAHHAAGLPLRPEYRVEGELSRCAARRMGAVLLGLPDPPTAIVAASDTLAIGVVQAARDRGLRLPEDLSVIGHDDIDTADVLGLTTIRQPLRDSGRLGMQRLLELVRNPRASHTRRVLSTELVVRTTTGRCPNPGKVARSR